MSFECDCLGQIHEMQRTVQLFVKESVAQKSSYESNMPDSGGMSPAGHVPGPPVWGVRDV